MAAQRPNPAVAGTTYMHIPAIADEIRRLDPRGRGGQRSLELHTGLLTQLMGSLYSRNQCITKLENPGGFDFNTLDLTGGTHRSFLITQCKSAEGEGKEGVWEDGAEQLLKYLKMQQGKRRASNSAPNPPQSYPMYLEHTNWCQAWSPSIRSRGDRGKPFGRCAETYALRLMLKDAVNKSDIHGLALDSRGLMQTASYDDRKGREPEKGWPSSELGSVVRLTCFPDIETLIVKVPSREHEIAHTNSA
ncbi:hypothetical protein CDV55_102127 [Aspergillus turcosus]|nr:hypothetical protein CDV55_102127 [Aspergillus turcosus]